MPSTYYHNSYLYKTTESVKWGRRFSAAVKIIVRRIYCEKAKKFAALRFTGFDT
jgi:hypothetical protein